MGHHGPAAANLPRTRASTLSSAPQGPGFRPIGASDHGWFAKPLTTPSFSLGLRDHLCCRRLMPTVPSADCQRRSNSGPPPPPRRFRELTVVAEPVERLVADFVL